MTRCLRPLLALSLVLLCRWADLGLVLPSVPDREGRDAVHLTCDEGRGPSRDHREDLPCGESPDTWGFSLSEDEPDEGLGGPAFCFWTRTLAEPCPLVPAPRLIPADVPPTAAARYLLLPHLRC